jgi:hypothetical protein
MGNSYEDVKTGLRVVKEKKKSCHSMGLELKFCNIDTKTIVNE